MFIKLTLDGNARTVNFQHVMCYEKSIDYTKVFLTSGRFILCDETPEELDKLIQPKEIHKKPDSPEEPVLPPEASIEKMELSNRCFNALTRRGCNTIDDVVKLMANKKDAYRIRNLGAKSIEEIINKLNVIGYHLTWE